MADTPTPPGPVPPVSPQRAKGIANLRPWKPGQSGNPTGISKRRQAVIERLKAEDGETIYKAFMDLVRAGELPAVLRGMEYIAGKPALAQEDRESLREALTVVVRELRVAADGEVVDVDAVQPEDTDAEETT